MIRITQNGVFETKCVFCYKRIFYGYKNGKPAALRRTVIEKI